MQLELSTRYRSAAPPVGVPGRITEDVTGPFGLRLWHAAGRGILGEQAARLASAVCDTPGFRRSEE